MPIDQATVDFGVRQAQACRDSADPRAAVLTNYIGIQLLYSELAKAGEIVPLGDLPDDQKQKYWKESDIPGASKNKRIWTCQALYMFDLLNKKDYD